MTKIRNFDTFAPYPNLEPNLSMLDGLTLKKFFDLGFSELVDKNGFGSNSTSGTPLYSSPEQLRGGFQTHNSDMFSIGCIFYELLTG